MKKQVQKKISLHKETLRNLSGRELKEVAGMTGSCCNSSDHTIETCSGASCRICYTEAC
jgi:hypothetical protein